MINTNELDNNFVHLLVSYVEEGLRHDALQMLQQPPMQQQQQQHPAGHPLQTQPHYLNQLILESATELSIQLDSFLR